MVLLTDSVLARLDSESQFLVDVIGSLALLSHFASYKAERVQSIQNPRTSNCASCTGGPELLSPFLVGWIKKGLQLLGHLTDDVANHLLFSSTFINDYSSCQL